jgi:hypothetical protein
MLWGENGAIGITQRLHIGIVFGGAKLVLVSAMNFFTNKL